MTETFDVGNPKYRRNTVIITVFTILCAVILLMYGNGLAGEIREMESVWVQRSKDAAQSSYILNNIQGDMGYGGFIHN